jgi:zinc transport system ATP-binding protein
MTPVAALPERLSVETADAAPARVIETGDALVSLSGVSLTLGGHAILDAVEVSVHPGEIVTVIGPNGAGKTTLGRVMLGLIKPDRGEVRRRADLRVGYVPQRFHIDPAIPLSVARFMTLARKASPDAIKAALAETGASRLADAALSTLSGGEFQRVLLARALIGAPDFLVLDEPVQAVDYIGEAMLYDLIAAIRNRRGCGILLISHDLHMVMKASDKVICLNRHVCCQGKPDAVANNPAYLKLFGFEGMEALGFYRHRHDHVHDISGGVCKTHAHD